MRSSRAGLLHIFGRACRECRFGSDLTTKERDAGNVKVAFAARSRAELDAFYAEALNAGGTTMVRPDLPTRRSH